MTPDPYNLFKLFSSFLLPFPPPALKNFHGSGIGRFGQRDEGEAFAGGGARDVFSTMERIVVLE